MGKMSVERLHELFDENQGKEVLMWKGTCHDCQSDIQITATPKEDGIHIEGGSVYEPEIEKFFLKCNSCFEKESVLQNYQSCEVYSRVVGYLRPVSQWNDGKQSEFRDREMFDSSVGSV